VKSKSVARKMWNDADAILNYCETATGVGHGTFAVGDQRVLKCADEVAAWREGWDNE
jgi:hypothetical protein